MTAASDIPTARGRLSMFASLERVRAWLSLSVHFALLGAAMFLLVLTAAPTDHWYLQISGLSGLERAAPLAIIAAFVVISERASNGIDDIAGSSFGISGSMPGIVGAAVLGGAGPAVAIAIVALAVGWFNYRGSFNGLVANAANFTWFALVAGLFFQVMQGMTGAASTTDRWPLYYLLVFATFVISVTVNAAHMTVYVSFQERTPLRTNAPPVGPMMLAQSGSAILTMIAVFATTQGLWGLLLFAVVLIVFQRLIIQLLKVQYLAEYDQLTRLPNRNRFTDLLRKRIESAKEDGVSFGVLLLDINRFRNINDTFGHEAGNDLLQTVASRLTGLRAQLGDGTVIARFGGDEFAILPEWGVLNAGDMETIANDVLHAFEEPVEITTAKEPVVVKTPPVTVEASVGAVRFGADGVDVETLLRRADIAMYAAKDNRHSYRLFDNGMESDTAATRDVLTQFRRALDEDELVLVYHPIVDLSRRQVYGAEALIRWQHPDRGLLSPFAFIDVVEQTSLIGELTKTVLAKAVAECARWRAAGMDLCVSANLSVRDLLDPELPSLVKTTLEDHGVPPESLKLEITESMIMYKFDEDQTVETVRKLGALGVKIAVDDFGTGHSSLAKLRLLPIDELKIDRSFVTPMLTSSSDRVIVESTIRLGHDLGLKVIAEGVETVETLQTLERMGCDRAQGHYMSVPMPAAEFPEWCRSFEEGYRLAA